MKAIIIFLLLFIYESLAIQFPGTFGTVLFSPQDLKKPLWRPKEMALLYSRWYFQNMTQPPADSEQIDDYYVQKHLLYFQGAYKTINLRAQSPLIDRIMTLALTDSLGAYLKARALPAVKYAYYSGQTTYDATATLFDFYNDIKHYLQTDGVGWHAPETDYLVEIYRNVSFKSNPEEGTENDFEIFDDPCSKLAYYVILPNGSLIVPTPLIKWETKPVTLILPLANHSLHSLQSRNTAETIKMCNALIMTCLKDDKFAMVDFQKRFQNWLAEEIGPHLYDDTLYPGLGNILVLNNSLCKETFAADDDDYNIQSSLGTIFGVIVAVELLWCAPAMLCMWCCRRQKKPPCTKVSWCQMNDHKWGGSPGTQHRIPICRKNVQKPQLKRTVPHEPCTEKCTPPEQEDKCRPCSSPPRKKCARTTSSSSSSSSSRGKRQSGSSPSSPKQRKRSCEKYEKPKCKRECSPSCETHKRLSPKCQESPPCCPKFDICTPSCETYKRLSPRCQESPPCRPKFDLCSPSCETHTRLSYKCQESSPCSPKFMMCPPSSPKCENECPSPCEKVKPIPRSCQMCPPPSIKCVQTPPCSPRSEKSPIPSSKCDTCPLFNFKPCLCPPKPKEAKPIKPALKKSIPKSNSSQTLRRSPRKSQQTKPKPRSPSPKRRPSPREQTQRNRPKRAPSPKPKPQPSPKPRRQPSPRPKPSPKPKPSPRSRPPPKSQPPSRPNRSPSPNKPVPQKNKGTKMTPKKSSYSKVRIVGSMSTCYKDVLPHRDEEHVSKSFQRTTSTKSKKGNNQYHTCAIAVGESYNKCLHCSTQMSPKKVEHWTRGTEADKCRWIDVCEDKNKKQCSKHVNSAVKECWAMFKKKKEHEVDVLYRSSDCVQRHDTMMNSMLCDLDLRPSTHSKSSDSEPVPLSSSSKHIVTPPVRDPITSKIESSKTSSDDLMAPTTRERAEIFKSFLENDPVTSKTLKALNEMMRISKSEMIKSSREIASVSLTDKTLSENSNMTLHDSTLKEISVNVSQFENLDSVEAPIAAEKHHVVTTFLENINERAKLLSKGNVISKTSILSQNTFATAKIDVLPNVTSIASVKSLQTAKAEQNTTIVQNFDSKQNANEDEVKDLTSSSYLNPSFQIELDIPSNADVYVEVQDDNTIKPSKIPKRKYLHDSPDEIAMSCETGQTLRKINMAKVYSSYKHPSHIPVPKTKDDSSMASKMEETDTLNATI